MRTPELSLAMIVRDCASDLDACLKGIAPFVDEIVIHDTGSTDDTVAVAKRYGAIVIEGTWRNDFAAARNVVRGRCTGRWILSLDSDERIDYLNAHRLRDLIRIAEAECTEAPILALAVVIEGPVANSDNGVQSRHVFPRLFRNDPDIVWTGAIHEQVTWRKGNLLAHARVTDIVIEHLGYAQKARHVERRKRNARILDAMPKRDSHFDALTAAHTAMSFERFEEAAERFESLLRHGLPENLDAAARFSYATCLMRLERRDEAERVLDAAIRRFPNHQSFRYLSGLMHLEGGRPARARERFEDLRALKTPILDMRTDVMPSRATLEVQIARTYLHEGDPLRALPILDAALRAEPSHAEGRFQRAAVLEALGRVPEARAMFEALAADHPEEPVIRERFARCRIASGDAHEDGLTVAMIVKDERANLEALLPTLAGFAEEVVVVDTGSTDGSVDVARASGARVLSHAWADDFAAARNAALEAVRTRWVLCLDADERLDEEAMRAIRAVTTRTDVDAVSLEIESPHSEADPVTRSAGTYCRLFRADIGARFEGRIHEQILPALSRRGARVTTLPITISHLGYALDAAGMDAKRRRNLALLERAVREEPTNGYQWFQLGSTLATMGEWAAAAAALERARTLEQRNESEEVRVWLRLRLAQAAFALGRFDDAERHALETLDVHPTSELATYVRAGVWLKRGRVARAIVCLRRILRSTKPDPYSSLRRADVAEELARIQRTLKPTKAAA